MNNQNNCRQNNPLFSICAALVLLPAIFLIPAGTADAALISYQFSGLVDELTDRRVDASDYGFSIGDIITGVVTVDDGHPDSNSNAAIGEYADLEIALEFWVSTSGGLEIYHDETAADDIEIKIENDNGGHNKKDKFEMEDKSYRTAITELGGGNALAYEKLKLKLEDDLNNDTFSSIIPTADASVDILDFNKKYEFELKFKDGGDEVKLKGDLTSIAVVPIPPAVWLFGSALGWLFRSALMRLGGMRGNAQ